MADYASDPEGYEELLRAKLQPARVRSTLAFAALFQLTHEMIKSMVLDDVKSFFGFISVGGDAIWMPEAGELEYKRHVLDRHPSRFAGSLEWLQDMDALDSEQADRLEDIYKHRHDLTHELAKYLVDPHVEPDYELLIEALKTLRSLARFWTEVEAAYGTFEDFPEIDLDQVANGRVLLIDLAISAFTDGLTGTPE